MNAWLEFPLPGWTPGAVYAFILAVGLTADLALVFYFLARPPDEEAPCRRLEARPWTWPEAGRMVLLLCALFLVATSVQSIGAALGGSAVSGNESLWLLIHSITFHWAGLALILSSLRRRRLSWSAAFGHGRATPGRDLVAGFTFYLGLIPILWFYSALYQVLLKYTGQEIQPQEVLSAITDEPSRGLRAYLLFLSIFLAPLVEELLFRGIALPLAVRRLGVGRGIVFVSLLFALVHFHLPSFVPLFILSVAFCLAYLYSGSIWVPFAMHALFNAVNLGLMRMVDG